MTRTTVLPLASLVLLASLAVTARAADPAASLKEGAPDIKSAGPLAFGPPGILFVADPLGAALFAIDTGDRGPASPTKELKVEAIDEKIAALIGTSTRDMAINDLAVNPASGKAYLSVSRGLGPDPTPVIVRVSADGKIEALPLEKVRFAKAALPDAPAPGAPRV